MVFWRARERTAVRGMFKVAAISSALHPCRARERMAVTRSSSVKGMKITVFILSG
jgi:hypothetical protein